MSGTLAILPVGGGLTLEPYTGPRPSLEQLQKAVGGYIERVKVRYDGRVREAYVNEEGLIEGLPFNATATRLVSEFGYGAIVGTIAVLVPDPRKPKAGGAS